MCRFKRELVNAVLRGKHTAAIPYGCPIPPNQPAQAERWRQVSDPHYVGAQLWDNPEETFPQPPKEFAMLRERFKDWLPSRLPEGARDGRGPNRPRPRVRQNGAGRRVAGFRRAACEMNKLKET